MKSVLLAVALLFPAAGFSDNLEQVAQPALLAQEDPEGGDELACAHQAAQKAISDDLFFAVVDRLGNDDRQLFVESVCKTDNPVDAVSVIVEGMVTVLNQ